jgi:glycosyltransferase 2 family protein
VDDRQRRVLTNLLRIAGIALGILAFGVFASTLVREWNDVESLVAEARPLLLVVALVLALGSAVGLAVLWRQVLRRLGATLPMVPVTAWYLVGEIGKYLPGGIWSVVGRSELATRAGVNRSIAYVSVALSLGLMCVSSAAVCIGLLPWSVDGGQRGIEYAVLLVAPVGLALLHPAVTRRLSAFAKRVSTDRLVLPVLPWGQALGLVLTGVPAWLLVGALSVTVAWALRLDISVTQVAFAAVLAWLAGFLVVPLPAGAGVREVVFVATCGLDPAPAVAVAAVARLMFVVADGSGALGGLAYLRWFDDTPAAGRDPSSID